jgi:hypothetical protein
MLSSPYVYRIYLKLMIDGMPSKPFSAATLGLACTTHVMRFGKSFCIKHGPKGISFNQP